MFILKVVLSVGAIIIGYGLGILGPFLSLQNRNRTPFDRIWAICQIIMTVLIIICYLYAVWFTDYIS